MKAKTFRKLNRLPLGAINPEGWLAEQLRRNADGMGGHLDELEPKMIATPYTTRETFEGWGRDRAPGWGAEISGNYWWGLIELAFTLNDPALIEKADRWVEAVLINRREDGYLGTYVDGDDFFDDYNAWGTSCGMNALLAYYDATGRKDVLDAVYHCMLWFCENWAGDRKTRYGGITITECMIRCYEETGDRRLLDFCLDYYRFLSENDLFSSSLEEMLSDKLRYNSNHGAGFVNHMDNPALLYACTGDVTYLEASINSWRKAKAKVVQAHGGVTCESEYLAPLGSIVETEYCAFTMSNKSLANLAMITGEATYADDMERIVFNGAQGARKKDERAMAYLSSPNQIYATTGSSYAVNAHQVYAPCVPVACCAVNSVRILPEFIRNIALEDGSRLYLSVYAPSTIRYKDLVVHVETNYPFEDTVRIRFSGEGRIPLCFRIPGWCSEPKAALNGNIADLFHNDNGYANLAGDPEFGDGDCITLRFPMAVNVYNINDSDRLNLQPLVVEYGPLLFSLPVPEQWNAFPGYPATPLPEGWNWFNVTAIIPPSGLDVYDDMGMRKHLISWNVALDEALSASDVKVVHSDTAGYVWENPPVRLELTGYKAPYLFPPYPSRTLDPHTENGYAEITGKCPLTLVPYGCTALRITYFPRARHGDVEKLS